MKPLYEIENHFRSVKPVAGNAILVNGWVGHNRTYLKDSEVPNLGDFRIPSANHTDVEYLANVEVVGRKVFSHLGDTVVRVRITFINGEEGDSVVSGFMVV